MGEDISFRCRCGTVTGHVADLGPRAGTHAVCHCSQCRAAEVFLGQPDPEGPGVALFQTYGDRVKFAQGQDHLGGFSFQDNRLIHWYATCCNAPLFNTMATPGMGFASLILARTDQAAALGPVRTVGFRTDPDGKQRHSGLGRMIVNMIWRTARTKLTGRWRNSPFFDAAGQPVAAITVLTEAQKAALPLQR